jgi:uncharacterized protein (DUF1015 family)
MVPQVWRYVQSLGGARQKEIHNVPAFSVEKAGFCLAGTYWENMVQILPFRGILYNPSYASPGVYAPPYDVIDAAEREAYLKRDPYNVVQLILRSGSDDDTWYQETACRLQRFLDEGILQRDEEPLLYGYRQRFTVKDGQTYVRTGFMGRVRLEEWEDGIYPHEHTRAEPLEDRLKLMRATQMNMSPIFGM